MGGPCNWEWDISFSLVAFFFSDEIVKSVRNSMRELLAGDLGGSRGTRDAEEGERETGAYQRGLDSGGASIVFLFHCFFGLVENVASLPHRIRRSRALGADSKRLLQGLRTENGAHTAEKVAQQNGGFKYMDWKSSVLICPSAN